MQSRFDSQTDVLLGGETVVFAEKKINRPNFVLPVGLDQFGRQLTAAEARYLPAREGLEGGYLLSGPTSPRALLSGPPLQLDGKPVVITPANAAWLAPD